MGDAFSVPFIFSWSEVIARKCSARTAKDRDVITTNTLANTTLGQSERAYYLSKLVWFSNKTGTSELKTARANQTTGLTNCRAANWQRKSYFILVLSARFPVVNWRSRSVAKSAHAKVGFAWPFAVRTLFTQSLYSCVKCIMALRYSWLYVSKLLCRKLW